MQSSVWKLLFEPGVCDLYFFQQFPGFFCIFTLGKDIWDQFKNCHILLSIHYLSIHSIPYEIEPGHAKSLFVDCIII